MLRSKLDNCVYKCTHHHLMRLIYQNDALTPYCSVANLGDGGKCQKIDCKLNEDLFF